MKANSDQPRMKINVFIPAHNKEKYIGRCLSSIHAQQTPASVEVETIVVLNRCKAQNHCTRVSDDLL